MINNHLPTLEQFLDLLSSKYGKILILGDLTVGVGEEHMKSFCEQITDLLQKSKYDYLHWYNFDKCFPLLSKHLCSRNRIVGFLPDDFDVMKKMHQEN